MKNLKLTIDEIRFLKSFMDMEVEGWEETGMWIEYRISKESYDISKKLSKKLQEVLEK